MKKYFPNGEVRYDEYGGIDEIAAKNCTIHLERMGDGHVWLVIYPTGEDLTDRIALDIYWDDLANRYKGFLEIYLEDKGILRDKQ